MIQFTIKEGVISRFSVLTLAATLCASLLSSCATAAPATKEDAVFRFSVLRYKEPVEVTGLEN